MDRSKNLALGAVAVLVLVLVIALAAIGGAAATAAILDDDDDDRESYSKEYDAKEAAAIVETAVTKALSMAAAKTPATAQASPAASQSGASQSGIWVSGEGSVTLEPDLATLGLGVESRGETVSDAIAEASTAMDAVLGALRGQGIEDRDVQTRNFNVWPEYEYQEVMQDGAMRTDAGAGGLRGEQHGDGEDQGPRLGWGGHRRRGGRGRRLDPDRQCRVYGRRPVGLRRGAARQGGRGRGGEGRSPGEPGGGQPRGCDVHQRGGRLGRVRRAGVQGGVRRVCDGVRRLRLRSAAASLSFG